MKLVQPYYLPFALLLFIYIMISTHVLANATHQGEAVGSKNKTSVLNEQLRAHRLTPEMREFLSEHNVVRKAKSEPLLTWDYGLEKYARWWAGQRKSDCELEHSFPEYEFKFGENIFWGSGSGWTAGDAVRMWAAEEKYYDYGTNSCQDGQICGHYTQIVWKDTMKVGCARVVCNNGDVFITCNYYPPGNYEGDRPY